MDGMGRFFEPSIYRVLGVGAYFSTKIIDRLDTTNS